MPGEQGAASPRRRARDGEGSIYRDEANRCYVGSISLGKRLNGTRRRPSVRGATEEEVRAKLAALRLEVENGVKPGDKYTVEDATRDFLTSGVRRLSPATVDQLRMHIETWIVPHLGQAKLKRLRADDVDAWLENMVEALSTSSIKQRLSTLRRIIRFAEVHDWVRRNVAELVDAPEGTAGRPSKALTLDQAMAILAAAQGRPIGAYIALSLFTGIRTEEARPLKWEHLHLKPVKGRRCSCGRKHQERLPPHVEIWYSVRRRGETKTRQSRRTVALPDLATGLLTEHQARQRQWRAEHNWKSEGLVYVFGTRYDTVPQAQVIRDQFRAVITRAGIGGSWTPRELRHSFVSIMSDCGASIELIADLVGHLDTTTTRTVYRHQLRPVITHGADLLNEASGERFLELKGR